jgi:hypothetical protein
VNINFLTKDYDFSLSDQKPFFKAVRKKGSCAKNQLQVNFPPPEAVKMEMDRLWQFAKKANRKILRGKSTMSPYDLMAYLRKWYLSIHPFPKDNERISALLEDMFSYIYDLPFVPSGYLNEDMAIPLTEYQNLTKEAIRVLQNELKNCYLSKSASVTGKCGYIYDVKEYSAKDSSLKNFIKFKDGLLEKCYTSLGVVCYQTFAMDFETKINRKKARKHPFQFYWDDLIQECKEVITKDDLVLEEFPTEELEKDQSGYIPAGALDMEETLQAIKIKDKNCMKNLSAKEASAVRSFTKESGEVVLSSQDLEEFLSSQDSFDLSSYGKVKGEATDSSNYKIMNVLATMALPTKKNKNLYLGVNKMATLAGDIFLWRGIENDPKLKVGSTFLVKSFFSTSILKSVALGFTPGIKKKLFKILSHHSAKSMVTLSDFPQELEFLLLPGTVLKVIKREEDSKTIVYTLLEI